jgi:hypothetical protein
MVLCTTQAQEIYWYVVPIHQYAKLTSSQTPLPLNTPTRVELSAEETVVITLLDANHCPGAVMQVLSEVFDLIYNQLHLLSTRFLIEGPKGAVLHTGDFRAEAWFLESLTRNPLLQRYLPPQDQEYVPSNPREPPPIALSTTLEVIYLDTACALSNLQIVTKVRIVFNLYFLVTFNHLSRIAL